MKKIVLICLLMSIFLIQNVEPFEFIGNCTDSNTLVIFLNSTFNGSARDFLQDPIICPHGCIENQSRYGDDCAPSPAQENAQNHGIAIAFSILLSVMSICFIYISMNISDTNAVLGWFFLPLSFVMMIINIFLLTFYTVDVGVINILSTTGYVMIITILFMLFYFIVFLFSKGFERMFNRDKERFSDKLRV